MQIDKLTIFTATQKSSLEETSLYKSIQELKIDTDLHFCGIESNKDPLPVVYNGAIQIAKDNNSDALIFIHDDVILEQDPVPKLRKLFDIYDMVGVAGCSQLELKEPALWHLMGGGFGGDHLHGAVAHGTAEAKQVTNFGQYPHRVLMIDGVFMAVNKKILENLEFDEENPCIAHFYDLATSYQAHLDGFKVGVADIMITHQSPGLREFTQDWKNGQKWFLSKYNN